MLLILRLRQEPYCQCLVYIVVYKTLQKRIPNYVCRSSILSFVCFYFILFSSPFTNVLFHCICRIRFWRNFFSKIFPVCIFLDRVNPVLCDKPGASGPTTNRTGVTGNRYERMARCIVFQGVCNVFKFSGRFGRARSVFFLPHTQRSADKLLLRTYNTTTTARRPTLCN